MKTTTQTKPERRGRVTERDIEILKYIKDTKTLNREQLCRRFWPNHKCIPLVIRRMNKLVERGYLTQVNNEFLKVSTYYYLTKKGLSALITYGLAKESERIHLPEATDVIKSDFQHNHRVADIRISLETEKGIRVHNWVSDMDIKSDPEAYGLKGSAPLKGTRVDPKKERKFRYRIPDAIFSLEDNEHEVKVILEYEHGRYDRWKFRTYLSAWEERWADYQKFLVAPNPGRVEIMTQWCLEDLKQRYRLELASRKMKLEDLAQNYMFTDYHSLVKKGLLKSGLKTPVSQIVLKPLHK